MPHRQTRELQLLCTESQLASQQQLYQHHAALFSWLLAAGQAQLDCELCFASLAAAALLQ
jgi:hypothetical protein